MSDNRFKNLYKVVLSLSGVVIFAKLLGFVKNIVMASSFGASIETDLITLAHTLVSNTEYVITQTLATAFVPVYISVSGDALSKEKKRFVSNSLKLFILVAVCLTAVFLLGSPIVSKIIAPSYDNEVSMVLAKYIRVLSPILITFVVLSLFNAILNAYEKYLPGELISVIGSLTIIVTIAAFSSAIGVDTIVIGLWCSAIISTVFLGCYSKKYWSVIRGNPFKDKDVIRLLKMVLPLLFGFAMVFINQQIDKIIVSGMEDGTVTAMSYGSALFQLVTSIISSFCMVMYTRMSVNSINGDHKQNADFTVNTLSVVFTVLIPITIITVICSRDIVRIVYEHGAFDSKATKSAAYALAGYGVMFIPFTIKSLFSRFLYSNMNTKSPARNNVIGILFNIALSLALYKPLGVFGVTFASSLADLLTGILNIISAKKINKHINFVSWIRNFKYWACGSIMCIFFVLCFMHFASEWSSSLIRFICCTFIGFISYSAPCYKLIKDMIRSVSQKSET